MNNTISYTLSPLKNSDSRNSCFKGNYRSTEAGNFYYHSNVGRNTCLAASGVVTAGVGILNHKKPKYALYTMLATTPLILMGLFADKIRNNQNKKSADLIAKYGFGEISEIDKDINVSSNNHAYKKSHSGLTIGSIMSAVLAITMLIFLTRKSIKTGQSVKDSLKNSLREIVDDTFAVDGMLFGPCFPITLGAGLDCLANLDAKKHS